MESPIRAETITQSRHSISHYLPVLVFASLVLGLLRDVMGYAAVQRDRAAVDGFDVVGTIWVNEICMTAIPLIVPLLLI